MTPQERDVTTYERLGVRPIINATCHWTDFGGAVMWPEVAEAMAVARDRYVNVHELLDKAGATISGYTHGEATHIVSGCSAGLLSGAAAIMAGDDRVAMAALPHPTDGMRNEFIAHRVPRKQDAAGRDYPVWTYSHAVRAAGGTLVEIGDDEGVTAEAIAGAIGPRTAGVYWLCDDPAARISLHEVVNVAHQHGLPVLLDASNTLPPPENIHAFMDMGVDLAAYSGGKGLRGPQGSGFLTGRADLIRAARLQSSPNDGVGRSLKVSKEEMIGLVTALEVWSGRDHAKDMDDAVRRTEYVVTELAELRSARAEYRFPDHIGRPYPTIFIHLDPGGGRTGEEVMDSLLAGEPSIATMPFSDPWVFRVDVRILPDSDVETVARQLRKTLS